jgi:hypothetical protein
MQVPVEPSWMNLNEELHRPPEPADVLRESPLPREISPEPLAAERPVDRQVETPPASKRKSPVQDAHVTSKKKPRYPSKSEISENRHSINSAFAASLEQQNRMKEESIKAKQLAEESRLMWEKEKYEREEARRLEDRLEARLEARLEKKEDREHAFRMQKDSQKFSLALAMMTSSKTFDELKKIYELIDNDKSAN